MNKVINKKNNKQSNRKSNKKNNRQSNKQSNKKVNIRNNLKKQTKKTNKKANKKSTNKKSTNKKLISKKRNQTEIKQANFNKKLDMLRDKLLKIRKQNQPHFGNTYVQNMSNDDFNGANIANSNPRKTGIVMFYAPWCPHCHSMVPVLNELADNIYENANTNDIIVGSVDCTSNSNQDLNDTMNIIGYPTLKLYVDGKYVSDYSGPRDANALLLTIQKLKH